MKHLKHLLPNFHPHPAPCPWESLRCFPSLVGLPFLDASYKWLCTQYVTFVYGFFRFTVFLRFIHTVAWMRMSFFLWLNSSLLSGHSTVCSSSHKSVDSEAVSASWLGNNTAVNMCAGDFPGSPVAKTPHFPCRERGFDPWSGN